MGGFSGFRRVRHVSVLTLLPLPFLTALPGKIIQVLRRVGTENPFFLIDEVDEIGRRIKGC